MFELEDRYWWFVGRRRLALGLLERRNLLPESRVLDFGCGTGVILSELQSRYAHAVGLDFATLALDFCRERDLGGLVRADGERLPFANASFDAVVGLDVFEHLRHDDHAFSEAARVLRPGGVVVLSVPAFGWLWGPHDTALHHFRRYRCSEVRRKLTDAGLEVETLSYAVFWLFPLVMVSRVLEKLRPGPAKASLPRFPAAVNQAFSKLLTAEGNRIVSGGRWPWGSSVVAVARKPA
jgi:SAM-dependent methyltransferase